MPTSADIMALSERELTLIYRDNTGYVSIQDEPPYTGVYGREKVQHCGMSVCHIYTEVGLVMGRDFPNLASTTYGARDTINGGFAVTADKARAGYWGIVDWDGVPDVWGSDHAVLLRGPVSGSKVPTREWNTIGDGTGRDYVRDVGLFVCFGRPKNLQSEETVTTWRGVTLDERTARMMDEVAYRMKDAPGGDVYIRPTQGCYNAGVVTASAGTHDGGGVLDVDTDPMSVPQRDFFIALGRQVGFAGWYRTRTQGFVPHAHLVAVGCSDLSYGAAAQVKQYFNGTNGLASYGRDDGPRDWVGVTWESYQANKPKPKPVIPQEVAMAGKGFFMQAQGDGKVYFVPESLSCKWYIGTQAIADDIAYILQATGGGIIKPPKGLSWGAVGTNGHPVWREMRPETLAAIPLR